MVYISGKSATVLWLSLDNVVQLDFVRGYFDG
jgi:hypothetical protein